MITAVRRITDGYLADIQVTSVISPKPVRVANALKEAGGEPGDWQVIRIEPALWQGYDPRCKAYLVSEEEAYRLVQPAPEPAPVEPDVATQIAALKTQIALITTQINALEKLIVAS